MTKIVEKFEKKYDTQIKVIHICGNGFIGKIELYTKLFTLSTMINVKKRGKRSENTNVCFGYKS